SGKPIPDVGRWKMIDNLRRSLSAPAMVLVLLGSWLIAAAPAAVWAAYVLLALAVPAIVSVVSGLIPRRGGIAWRSHVRAVRNDMLYGAAHTGIAVVLLAHQAWLACDAIGRTLFRLLISRRLMLEWVTAAQSKRGAGLSILSF